MNSFPPPPPPQDSPIDSPLISVDLRDASLLLSVPECGVSHSVKNVRLFPTRIEWREKRNASNYSFIRFDSKNICLWELTRKWRKDEVVRVTDCRFGRDSSLLCRHLFRWVVSFDVVEEALILSVGIGDARRRRVGDRVECVDRRRRVGRVRSNRSIHLDRLDEHIYRWLISLVLEDTSLVDRPNLVHWPWFGLNVHYDRHERPSEQTPRSFRPWRSTAPWRSRCTKTEKIDQREREKRRRGTNSISSEISTSSNSIHHGRSENVCRIDVSVDICFECGVHCDQSNSSDHFGMIRDFHWTKNELWFQLI